MDFFAINIDKFGKKRTAKKIKEGKCLFPFRYQNKLYDQCVDGKSGKWCATSLNKNKTSKTWAYCPTSKKSSKKKVIKKINNDIIANNIDKFGIKRTSKKIASGIKSLVLDVKVGNGSFNSTIQIAENLAQSLVSVAKGANLQCKAIITDMNQVLGRNAGHSLEVIECIEYLTTKKRDQRLEIITNDLASSLLMMIKKVSKEEALDQINLVLNNGLAAEKFEKMVHALGGSACFLSTYKHEMYSDLYSEEILFKHSGWIKEINTRKLGLLLIELGAGRKHTNDKINYHAGYTDIIGVGEKFDEKKPILKIFSRDRDALNKVKNEIIKCFVFSDNAIKQSQIIYKVVKFD